MNLYFYHVTSRPAWVGILIMSLYLICSIFETRPSTYFHMSCFKGAFEMPGGVPTPCWAAYYPCGQHFGLRWSHNIKSGILRRLLSCYYQRGELTCPRVWRLTNSTVLFCIFRFFGCQEPNWLGPTSMGGILSNRQRYISFPGHNWFGPTDRHDIISARYTHINSRGSILSRYRQGYI